jgi:peptide/nickel transport system permease protein
LTQLCHIRLVLRRLGALVFTVVAALVIAHFFLKWTLGDGGVSLTDRFLHGDFGSTPGHICDRKDYIPPLCGAYPAAEIRDMLRQRVPVDLSLLLGGMICGTLGGLAGGRWCATRPHARSTRGLHIVTALQLSTPAFFQALFVLFFFSSNTTEYVRLPFLSGAGQYVPLAQDPILWLRAMWMPILLCALPLAAFVLRLTEAHLTQDLAEDFTRTARSKGLPERRVVNRHALPVTLPAIGAMTGVSVSTMLLNVAVMEYAFSIPGMFRVINLALLYPDVPVLEAIVLEGVLMVTLANFAADIFHWRLDPRLRTRTT